MNISNTVDYKETVYAIEDQFGSSSQVIKNQQKLWQAIYPYIFQVQLDSFKTSLYYGLITVPYALSFAKNQHFTEFTLPEQKDPTDVNFVFDSYIATGITICVSLVLPIAPVFFSAVRSTRKSLIATKLAPRKEGLRFFLIILYFRV